MIRYLYILRNDWHNKLSQHPPPYVVTLSFLAVRTFKIYSLSNLQIEQHNIVWLTTGTILEVCTFWLTSPTSHTSSPAFGDHQSVLCIHEFRFFLLDSTYKWDHTVFVFLCLTHLSTTPSRSIHVVTSGRTSFLMVGSYFMIDTHHIFFIHSPISGHLGCFYILAIVNNAEWAEQCIFLFKIVILFLYSQRLVWVMSSLCYSHFIVRETEIQRA